MEFEYNKILTEEHYKNLCWLVAQINYKIEQAESILKDFKKEKDTLLALQNSMKQNKA